MRACHFIFILLFSINLFSQTPSFQWVKRIGGNLGETARSMTKDASGNFIIIANFSGTVDLDPGPGTFTLASVGMNDVFILKLTANGNFIWGKQIGGVNNQYGNYVQVDASDNVYFCGTFDQGGTVDFDPGPGTYTLNGTGSSFDAYIEKLDPNGNFVWVKPYLGDYQTNVNCIKTDISGNIIIAGFFDGTADFDPGAGTYTMYVNNNRNAYVSKLDPSGNFLWAKQLTGISVAGKCVVQTNGDIITIGSFQTIADFDPGPGTFTINSGGGDDVFISKLDASGNFVWAKSFTGGGPDFSGEISLDATGNILLNGGFNQTVDFDPGPSVYTITTNGGSDIFVTKLDPLGNFIWAKRVGGTGGQEFGLALDIDNNGDIWSTGYFQGTSDFDPGAGTYTLSSVSNGTNVFMLKLASTGSFVWAGAIGGSIADVGRDIITDLTGNVFVVGEYYGPADLDPGPSTYTLPSNDCFFLKLGPCVAPDTPTITGGSQPICPGANYTLNIVGNLNGSSAWNIYSGNCNGTLVTSSNNSIIVVNPTTTINYYIGGSGGCVSTSTCASVVNVSVVTCAGIGERSLEENEVFIFPNPNTGLFYLKLAKETEILIFDAQGKLVFHESRPSGTSKIDLQKMEKGLYLISIVGSGKAKTMKFIKE